MSNSLLGRETELEALGYAIRDGLDGRGRVLLVTGEAGIGKSRLLREFEQILAASGFRVAWGRAWEVGGAPAFWPWIEVFRDLGLPWEDANSAGSAEARFALFDRLSQHLTQLATETPIALLLDDVHVADAATLLLLLFVTRQIASRRIILIAAGRADWDTLAPIGREATTIELGRLSETAVATWVGDSERGAEIHRRSDGLPLFVEELIRVGSGGAEHRLRSVLDEHLGALDTATRALLGRASVIGRNFALDDLARSPGTRDEAAVMLKSAVDRGVLRRSDEGYEFSHILLRDQLYESLEPTLRDESHWLRGMELVSRNDLSSGAHHLLVGIHAGDPATVGDVVLRAARREHRQLGFETAIDLCERALGVAHIDRDIVIDLHLAMADALLAAGEIDRGREEAATAFEMARSAGSADRMAEAALTFGKVFFTARVNPRMLLFLEAAIAAEPRPSLTPVLYARLAAARVPPRSPEEAAAVVDQARRARQLALDLGDPEVLLETLRYAGPAFGYLVGTAEAEPTTREMLDVALALDRPEIVVNIGALAFTMRAVLGMSDAEEAVRAVERAAPRVAEAMQWRVDGARASLAFFTDELANAASHIEQLRLAATRQTSSSCTLGYITARIGLATLTQDFDSIAQELDAESLVPPMHMFRPWVLATQGRMDEAVTSARTLLQGPIAFPQLIVLGAIAALASSPELAAEVREPLAGEIGRNEYFMGPAGAFCVGSTSLVVADLDRLMGNEQRAIEGYQRALALAEHANFIPMIRLIRGRFDAEPAPRATSRSVELRRHGDLWALLTDGRELGHLPDVKGMSYLARLLDRPDCEITAVELIGADHRVSAGAPAIDEAAANAYRERVQELREELAQAETWADLGRAQVARDELEHIRAELARAFGLGNKARKVNSDVERARINVQRRIKDAIDRIAKLDADTGTQLRRRVRTGTVCCFEN